MSWYAVIRYGGGEPLGRHAGDLTSRPWTSLSSALFTDPDEAREFAAKLDNGQVFELLPIDGEPTRSEEQR